MPQFRFNVNLPLRAKLRLRITGGRAEDSLLRGLDPICVRALGNLPEQFGKKRIKLRYLEGIFLAAELHLSSSVRRLRGGDIRGAAGRRAQPAPASRSREWSAQAGALRAYASPPFLSLGQKLSETPLS